MNNKSPIPKWPLYVADATLLAAVFAIAYPNIVLMETMSAAGILLCSLLCAGAMSMVLAPFVFEYLNQKQQISSDARKVRADIDLIFENLSALQLMIAETREMGDSIEEKLAFQLAKDTDVKFESFNNALEDLRNLTKTDVKTAAQKVAEMLESLAQTDARIAELSAEVSRLADSRDAQTLETERAEKKYEEVLDELDALKNDVAALGADIERARKQTPGMRELDDAVVNAPADDFDSVSDEEELATGEPDSNSKRSETNIPEVPDEETAETADSPVEFEASAGQPDTPTPERDTKNKLEGIMQKALNNAASNAGFVEKIISGSGAFHSDENEQGEDVDAHASSEIPEEEPDNTETSAAENTDIGDPDVDTEAAIPPSSEPSATDGIQDNSTPDPMQDSDLSEEKIDDTLLDGLDFDEQSDPDAEDAEAAQKAVAATAAEDMLFDNAELLQTKKPVYKKGASIILRSMIGIGNKPYLRGNIAPLSPDKGIEMDYAEIGVWKLPLPDFEGELTFSVWKNDEEQIGNASYNAESGRKTEIII